MLKSPLALFETIERMANLIRSEFRHLGADEGLAPVHLQAMLYLEQANRFSNTPQGVAEYLALSKGTVSQSLQLLDRHGLIERYQDADDRRVVRLRLTETGEVFLDRLNPTAKWLEATRDISANRMRNGVSMLRDLLLEWKKSQTFTEFGSCIDCRHLHKKNQRNYHCGWYGERLTGAETRQICRAHITKSSPSTIV